MYKKAIHTGNLLDNESFRKVAQGAIVLLIGLAVIAFEVAFLLSL